MTAIALAACSGGGGDPGTCNASAETCAAAGGSGSSGSTGGAGGTGSTGTGTGTGGSGTGSGTSIGSPVLVTNQQITERITCLQIEALNGGDKQKAWLAIQEAYVRGAKYLDGNTQDGVPCSSYGYPP